MNHSNLLPVIGLEVHVELSTKSKLFCACSTKFGASPNTNICPVCTGLPGSLPVVNRAVVESAIAVGLALHCDIQKETFFDRKNYIYPDNPQGYQISQLYCPIAKNGYLSIPCDAITLDSSTSEKRIRIHELHMEDDAGKLLHHSKKTSVDYNRSGIPLLEIVTEPDFSSANEVISFIEKLRQTLLYLGVSDCRLEEGSMRVDVNLSVHRKGFALGTRTETKNLNSTRAISHAIEAEIKRQIALLEEQKPILQETRRYDDKLGTSTSMRSKEDRSDYRYFPEPDLPPIAIHDEWIEKIKASLPKLREEKLEQYQKDYGLSSSDAERLTSVKRLTEIFEATLVYGISPQKIANRLLSEALSLCRSTKCHPEDITLNPQSLATLLTMTEEGDITSAVSKELFALLFENDFDPRAYAKDHQLLQVKSEEAYKSLVNDILQKSPQSVADVHAGKTKALTFLVGQAMKQSQGRLNPGKLKLMFEQAINPLKQTGK